MRGPTKTDGAPPERRSPWTPVPNPGVPPGNSWTCYDDDTLLAWLQNLAPARERDETLVEIIKSNRHFYVRQTAASRISDPEVLKAFAADRHVGQILARRLSRAEDVDYLTELLHQSRHLEVRRAAAAQLSQVWDHLGRNAKASA